MGLPMIRCAIYARVSTDRQGDSLENQIGQCQEYISRLGGHYDTSDIKVYRDEAISGYYTSVFDRVEMKEAINDARSGNFQLLVFKEICRVGRDKHENPTIIGMFEQYGVRVVAINDNYDSLNKDNITFDILSVLSEQESKKISARVSSARRQKARRGEWGGEPPIGYRVNKVTKRLEVDLEYKEIPKLIFDLYVNVGLGTFKVAEYLNRQGFKTKNNNLWSRETVNRVLRNPAYISHVVYGTRRNKLQRHYDDSGKMTKKKVQIRLDPAEWQVVENAHEALVTKKMYEQAQHILDSKSHLRTPRRAYHPLTGLLQCGKCGKGMVCQKRSNKDKKYRYYICTTYHKFGRNACSQANVNADEVERLILNLIRSKLNLYPTEWVQLSLNIEDELVRLTRELKGKQSQKVKQLKDQMDLFHQRDYFTNPVYENQMTEAKRQILFTEVAVDTLLLQIKQLLQQGMDKSSMSKYIEDFKKLELTSMDQLKVLLQELINQITLTDDCFHIEYRYDFKPGGKFTKCDEIDNDSGKPHNAM